MGKMKIVKHARFTEIVTRKNIVHGVYITKIKL